MRLIIDSHLDLSWNAMSWNRDLTEPVALSRAREAGMTDDDARGHGTVSLPDMRQGGVALCCGTILVRAKRQVKPAKKIDLDVGTQQIACAAAQGQLAHYRLLAERGEISMIADRRALRSHWSRWLDSNSQHASLPGGLILTMEGADPILSPSQAEHWWNQGLRAVGLAHYGQSHYAVGTGESGPLTSQGVDLLKELDRLGMILDATHLCDRSFFQALELFGGPVMASHNNCRALVPGDRQFSEEQIALLVRRGTVIGVALDSWMLKPGFTHERPLDHPSTLADVADQIDHICQLAGNVNHAAIGTDLDGGFGTEESPADLDTIADLQKLSAVLSGRGYSELAIDQVFHGNWLRFFSEALPA